MTIRLSEAEFIEFLYRTPVAEFIEMSDTEYQELLRKAETTLQWLRNARTLRPVIMSRTIVREIV